MKTIGAIPGSYVKETTGGKADWDIPVELNTMLLDEKWDLIINLGHVVPHEVLGFANHNKNYFIGIAGKDMICAAHIACRGLWYRSNNLGCLITPLRACTASTMRRTSTCGDLKDPLARADRGEARW